MSTCRNQSGAERHRHSRRCAYRVTYVVTRAESYDITATNAAEARARAFLHGAFASAGDVTRADALYVDIIANAGGVP